MFSSPSAGRAASADRAVRPTRPRPRVPCSGGGNNSFDLPSEEPSPEALVTQADSERATRERVHSALDQLSRRERQVLEKRHLEDQPHTLSEIGRDLGVSRERIRQLELRACDKLRRVLEVA